VFLKSREGFKGKGECKGRDKERCWGAGRATDHTYIYMCVWWCGAVHTNVIAAAVCGKSGPIVLRVDPFRKQMREPVKSSFTKVAQTKGVSGRWWVWTKSVWTQGSVWNCYVIYDRMTRTRTRNKKQETRNKTRNKAGTVQGRVERWMLRCARIITCLANVNAKLEIANNSAQIFLSISVRISEPRFTSKRGKREEWVGGKAKRRHMVMTQVVVAQVGLTLAQVVRRGGQSWRQTTGSI
jgi:hypothetical protein